MPVPGVLPVLLGGDANVYGMARSFWEAFGVRSVAVCRRALPALAATRLLQTVVCRQDLGCDAVFVRTLAAVARAFPARARLLVPCADDYALQLARCQSALAAHYRFACPPPALVQRLGAKTGLCRRLCRAGPAHAANRPAGARRAAAHSAAVRLAGRRQTGRPGGVCALPVCRQAQGIPGAGPRAAGGDRRRGGAGRLPRRLARAGVYPRAGHRPRRRQYLLRAGRHGGLGRAGAGAAAGAHARRHRQLRGAAGGTRPQDAALLAALRALLRQSSWRGFANFDPQIRARRRTRFV